MAEASILPFGYVILVGIILGFILFVLRECPLKSILNTTKGKSNEVTLTKSNLLQVNAIVISGLFILLTIQGASESGVLPFVDVISRQDQMERYQEIMNDTSEDLLVREEAQKRYVEIKLDLERDFIKFNHEQNTLVFQMLLNPVTFFSISMIVFVISSIITIISKRENDLSFRVGEGFTILGFFIILTSSVIMLSPF